MKKGFLKRISMVGLSLMLVGIMAGCGSSPARESNLPPWLDELPPDGMIWGIGSAKQSKQTSRTFSMTKAEEMARIAIARQLNSSVQAMFINYNQDAGTANNQVSISLQQEVSRSVTDVQLNGATRNKYWEAPDGTWWCRVEFKKSDAKDALASILDSVFDSEAARYAEFKTDEALKMLDTQLAKKERPLQVNN